MLGSVPMDASMQNRLHSLFQLSMAQMRFSGVVEMQKDAVMTFRSGFLNLAMNRPLFRNSRKLPIDGTKIKCFTYKLLIVRVGF